VRILFALSILVACCRLWLGLQAVPIGLPSSEAHDFPPATHAKLVQDDWMNAVGEIMNGSPGLPRDAGRPFFDRIMAEVSQHQDEAAAAGFRLFLELHPDSPLSVQADYWLGECEYRLGHYQEAIQAFDRALSRAPLQAPLAASAFLRKGRSYAELGDVQRSRGLLELLVAQFPETEEAKEARHALLVP
jgi:tetratricopeptide (TPR) repeat protein